MRPRLSKRVAGGDAVEDRQTLLYSHGQIQASIRVGTGAASRYPYQAPQRDSLSRFEPFQACKRRHHFGDLVGVRRTAFHFQRSRLDDRQASV